MGGTNLLITRETDYALRILRVLSNGKQVTTGDICKQQSIPQQFAYKILKKLERAGLVLITRGAEGGCRLVADLQNVNLYDLTKIMDGDNLISACTKPGHQCAWRQKYDVTCNVNRHLLQIQNVLDTELRSHSLQQMLSEED